MTNIKLKSSFAAGIDFGGTNTRMAIVGRDCRIVAKQSIASASISTPSKFLEWSNTTLHALAKASSISYRSIEGVGVGVPGSTESERGIVHELTNLPHWKNVPLAVKLKNKLKRPVWVDNDANAMAFGEYLFGAAKGYQSALFLTLGTGVGGGLVLDGKPFHGKTFSAVEIGHMRYSGARLQCGCGSKGCIETLLGHRYLLERAKKEIRQNPKSKAALLAKKEGGLSLEIMTRAANAGDKFAKQFWASTGNVLGDFLAGIANLLNPDVIVLGGGVMGAGKHLLDPLRIAIRREAFSAASSKLKIVKAKFASDAGLIGAASLAFKRG